MSESQPPATTVAADEEHPTLGALVHQLSEQIPGLIRSEVRLAQAELAEKGKRAGIGIGMFSAAGLLSFFGAALLVCTAVLALALALPGWAATLVVALVLFGGAGLFARRGVSRLDQATPPKPERAIEGIKDDVATVKGDHR